MTLRRRLPEEALGPGTQSGFQGHPLEAVQDAMKGSGTGGLAREA
jgi:hypothetical protein